MAANGAVGIVGAVVLLASFMSHDDAVPIRSATVQPGTIRSIVSTNGKVEPLQSFEAHAPVGTTVKKLLVREGDHVNQGQLMVQLDDADARSQAAKALAQIRSSEADVSAIQSGGNREEVLTLEAQLAKTQTQRDAAQRNVEALRRLQQQGAASPGEVKAAENQLAGAEADLKFLQQKQKDRYSKPEVARVQAQENEAQSAYAAAEDILSKLNVRAPFDGIVYSLPARQGGYVNPGDLILQEADLSKVLVRSFVDEPDVGRLAPGQKIEITWDAVPGRIWTGALNTVPASVKLRGTRNVGETTCMVDNKDFKLLPNINVGVTIVTAEHHDVLTVPREAVRQEDSKVYVLQVVNNELHRRDVQTSIYAISTLQQEISASPNDAAAYNLLCRAYFSLSQWDRGIAACEKAVFLDPNNSLYHLWLGRIYGEKADASSFFTAAGLAKKVRNQFEMAVQLSPSSVDARTDLAEFYLEAPGIVGGGQDKARAQAATLARLDPAKAHWVNYKHTGRFDQMEGAINRAASAQVNHPVVLVDAAETLIRTGRNFPGAIQLLRRYLSSSSTVEEAPAFKAHYLLGTALEKQGDKQAAAQEYRTALSMAKGFSRAQEALDRVSR